MQPILLLSLNSFASIYTGDRQVPSERVTVIPNWAEEDKSTARSSDAVALRQRFAVPESAFLVAYGGNIGVAAGVETFVDSFRYLGDQVYGLVAGEGSRLNACQNLAYGIPNLFFLAPWPADLTMPLYQAADLLVLPTQGNQSMASVPSKLIRYMLSGRPIVAACLQDSELAAVVKASGCGWLVEPDQPDALANMIAYVKDLPASERQSRGRAGREYALQNLTAAACLPKVLDIIERAAK